MAEQHKRNPNTKCLICEKQIYKRPSQIKNAKGRVFCCSACYGVSCRKETECVICGKLILAGLHKKTCSRSCSNKNRAGIVYKVNRPKDKVVTQRAIKLRIFKLKGEKCERCSYNKSEILQLHHKNRNRNDNRVENLEIICPNCHYEEHFLNHLKKN